MRNRLGAASLLAAVALACALPAHADNYPVKDGAGNAQTFSSKFWSGVQHPLHLLEVLIGGAPTQVSGDGIGAAVDTNVRSSVLPTGAATAANQASGNTKLDQLHTDNQDTRAAAQTVTAADSASSTSSGQNSVPQITGTPTANSAATFAVNGQSGGALTVTGTFNLTGQIEASYDGGASYVAASGLLRGTSVLTSQVTAPGVWSLDLTGVTNLRLRATAYTSGTLSVKLTSSPAPGMTKILNPVLPGPTASTTDRSISSWTTGGTAQQVMAANTSRRSFYVFNPNASGICWGSFTTATPAANGAGAFPIPSLGGFGMEVSPTTSALYVNCPTTGQVISAWESQ